MFSTSPKSNFNPFMTFILLSANAFNFDQTELLSFGNPFPNKPWFLRVCSTTLLKTLWEKEKLHITSNFSFSDSVFYSFGEPSAIFIKVKIVVCKLFQFWKILKFVIWERDKELNNIVGKGENTSFSPITIMFSNPQKIILVRVLLYSVTCIQRLLKGSNESGLLQEVVFEYRFC